MDNYTQFKLTNGDELIAEIVDEPEGDDTNIVIRNAMQIFKMETSDNVYRYYGFRPWMIFQLKKDYMQLLNYNHIVGEAKPDLVVLSEYKKALISEAKSLEEKQDELEDQYNQLMSQIEEHYNSVDSDQPNVIPLSQRKPRLH